MRLQRFDLNLLVFLDALLEEQNVTRAGERLNIGQSAASGALGRLPADRARITTPWMRTHTRLTQQNRSPYQK